MTDTINAGDRVTWREPSMYLSEPDRRMEGTVKEFRVYYDGIRQALIEIDWRRVGYFVDTHKLTKLNAPAQARDGGGNGPQTNV